MRKIKRCLRPRQQQLALATEDLWQRLPQAKRLRCQELVVQLLRHVVRNEERERDGHE